MAGLDTNPDALAIAPQRRRVWALTSGSWFGYLILVLILLGPIVAVANYLIFSHAGIVGVRRTIFFIASLSYVLVLVTVIGVHLSSVIMARRRKSAGSQLHLRLTGMFALIALVPTVIVAAFATLMVDSGIERWFSDRVGNIVRNSLVTAEAYEKEHLSVLIRNVELMQNELNQAAGRLTPGEMREYFREQSIHRNLDEAFIFSSDFTILARGEFSYLFTFEEPTQDQLDRALAGELVLIDDNVNGEIRALVHLTRFQDAFLLVTRSVQGEVLRLLDQTRETVQFYEQLERDRNDLLIGYAVRYIALSILVILSAILLGLWFAERLARPVGRLAGAADAIGRGNLNVRVAEGKGSDEIAMLSRAFNRMTGQVKDQRDALIHARDETERRRHFIEAVLSGVTAGVVGLDSNGRVDLINDAAAEMLGIDADTISDEPMIETVPAFKDLIDAARESPSGIARGEVRINLRGEPKEFLAQIAARSPEDLSEGFVMTFDDVTALVSAQRMAAWGDIARRIAHEIKNPLTPIQLSADRMRRKFAKRLGEDSQRFEEYIDVITRQAGDIRRMVDEFSKFARLPEPEMRDEDLVTLTEQALVLQREGHAEITYEAHLPDHEVNVICDRGLINQCLVNLLQNAADAIEARQAEPDAPPARIVVQLTVGTRNLRLMVIDNGIGLPEENRERLKEPYVTNRANGTGLGLSIVSRIIEQHGGEISLSDADGMFGQDGAMVEIRLPRPAERAEKRSKSDQ
ncbi:PAS domain-containing sensor histidine kinase [Rhodobacteraceae bacterium NNCM2]|nr:PAS domain-containing sensor histidine kinase [Coraliihabitans acroporae]